MPYLLAGLWDADDDTRVIVLTGLNKVSNYA